MTTLATEGMARAVNGTGTMVSLPPEKSSSVSTEPTRESSTSLLGSQHEGVLRDVLDELDRERSQRAEMEARLRVMEEELHSQRRRQAQMNGTGAMPSQRELVSLRTERDGYLEIITALTKDRPAFGAQQKLPIHVVRLLEIMPWDARARQHLFGQEVLYEWQIYGADKSWQKDLRQFPVIFKTLPSVVPQPGRTVGEAPTSSSPPKRCVLTNVEVTQILNIDKGYPLPQDGGDWKWIGGWRIEKSGDTDADGWSYASDQQLTLKSSYFSEFRAPTPGAKNLVRRRRKWTRSRVMVDYPQASAMSKEYLKLVAEKSSLDVSVTKLSSQLVDTKMKLTTLESEHLASQETTRRKIGDLEKVLQEKTDLLRVLQEEDESRYNAAASSVKKVQVKELRSVVSQWVSNTVTKRSADVSSKTGSGDTIATSDEVLSDDEMDAPTSTINDPNSTSKVKQQMFESLKGKGSDLFEKFKQKGGAELEKIKQSSNSLSWPKKRADSADLNAAVAAKTEAS